MRVIGIDMDRYGLKERYNRRVAVTIFDKKGARYSESLSLRRSSNICQCQHSLRYFSEYNYPISGDTVPALKYTKYDDIGSLSNISIPIIKIKHI